ncbi:hypothetical protein E8E13_005265 [Curvularia kusanoi]|uniref:BZIP domain-containing protein n=1 Tax=Curvularia kusanoi TaxID=90978 RepID=A0A9P4T6Z3_CURKU|nr:hypothetical protein E8E13_005265 [Curvularia kusanoi]
MQFAPSQRVVGFFYSYIQHHDNSEQLPSHHGQPPISWDHDLNFTTAASSSALLDTSLPLASTSLFPTLTATGNTLYDTPDWNSLQLPTAASEPFTGNVLQHNLTSGGPPLVLTAEEQISLLAMAPATQASFDMSLSTPMEPNRSQSGSSSATFHNRSSYSPEQSPNTRMSNSTKSSPPNEPPSKVEKRRANTLAARRYRQKRVDQMSGLEAELKEVKAERDEWKVRCAKLEGEVEALRALLRSQK